jgi:hypothetical protein
MKTKFTLLALFVSLGSLTLEAATATCTCAGNKQKTVPIGLGDDPKPVCERECKKMGLEYQSSQKN